MAGVMQSKDNDVAPEAVETDVSTQVVSDNSRASKGSLTMAWWGVCSAMFYIFVGLAMAKGYGTKNAIIGLVLSVVIYGAINYVIARYAVRTGLSVALFSRILFGSKGSALATLIFFATAIYYAVFEGSVIAATLNLQYKAIPYWLGALFVVLYSVPLIFGSVQHWLDKFNGVLLPFYLLGIIGSAIYATMTYGYNDHWLSMGPATPVAHGWWDVTVFYMGVWVLMMFTFDYARFGKKEDIQYHSVFNFGAPFYIIAFLLNGLYGIYLVGIVPHADGGEVEISQALISLMGFWGLLFVWITQTRINTANFFLATTNMQAFFQDAFNLKLGKIFWAVIVGIVVFILMNGNVFAYILQALAYQGVFVVAWVAIALTHILSPRFNTSDTPIVSAGALPAFDVAGLASWIIASVAGIVAMSTDGAFKSFYAVIAFVVAAVLYSVLKKKS